MATFRVTKCTVKTGPNLGAAYYVRKRSDWGRVRYTCDEDRTGWHSNAKAAREAAERNGWVFTTRRDGSRELVHSSAIH